jgi:hypothetical protein
MAIIEWNNSKLSLLQRCGEAFRRRYIEEEVMPPSPRMLRGTVVHSVATTAMLRKYDEGELPTVEEAKDLAASAFDLNWRGVVTLSREERAEGLAKVGGHSKDFAIDLSGFHVETVAPSINPVAVERRITIKPKDSDLVIHGTIDLVDGTPEGEIIRDLKTTERAPIKNAADLSPQLTMYAMLRKLEVGRLPVKQVLDYLIRTPRRAERKHVILETTRDEADITAYVARINVSIESVKKGVFMPTSPDNWWCAPNWCDYHSTCPYVTHGVKRPTT